MTVLKTVCGIKQWLWIFKPENLKNQQWNVLFESSDRDDSVSRSEGVFRINFTIFISHRHIVMEFLPPCSFSCIRRGSICLCPGQPPPCSDPHFLGKGPETSNFPPSSAPCKPSDLLVSGLFSILFLFHSSIVSFLFLAFYWCLCHQPSNLEELQHFMVLDPPVK